MTADQHLTRESNALAHNIAALLASLTTRSANLSDDGRRVLEDAWTRFKSGNEPGASVRAEPQEAQDE